MTQATVNVDSNAVNDLNPNAQQFVSSDVHYRSPAGNDMRQMDPRSGSYLHPYASSIYPVNPSILDPLQQQQQQQRYEAISSTGPPPTSHSSMPDKLQVPLSPEQIREKLSKQLEYYFSKENLINDIYLQSQMDTDHFVPISIIASFKLVRRLTDDLQLIIDVLKELPSVEVDGDERKVRPSDQQFPLPLRTRCIIILRNVPSDASESEISDLFVKGHCPASAIEYERVLESDHSDCWYVTFANEDEAQNAFIYLTRENVAIRGQKILARMKSRLWQKSVPPTESNGSHQPADETKNNAPLPPSPRYTFVYLQPTVSSQSNQSTLLNNIQQPQGPANNYRPVQILPSPYLPGNYNTYLPYDRNGWTTAVHPSNVPSILSYSTAAQQAHLNSYPASFHPMMPQHSVFPTNYWYIPSTADSYPNTIVPLQSLIRAYSGASKSKSRIARDHTSTSKPHSTKALVNDARSAPEELIVNSHLDGSLQSSTSNSINDDPSLKVASAIYYNKSSTLDANLSRTYADMLKLKQISQEAPDATSTLPVEQLTLADNPPPSQQQDRQRNHKRHGRGGGGNARLYHRSRGDLNSHSTVPRSDD